MAPPLRAVVAVVAERPVLAHLVVAEQLRLLAHLVVAEQLLLQRQPAHLVALEVAAARPVLPQEAEVAAAEVAAAVLVQGLVASESLRRR